MSRSNVEELKEELINQFKRIQSGVISEECSTSYNRKD